jgi:hypothetical protein
MRAFLRRFAIAVCLLIVVGTTSTTQAQTGSGRVAFGAHGGLNKYWGTFTDNRWWWGGDLFLRWNIIPYISFHAQFGLNQLRIKVNDQNLITHPEYFGPFGGGVGTGVYPNSNGTPTNINREVLNAIRVNTYSGLISYNITPNQRLVPYLFAGIGLLNFEPRNLNQNVALPNNSQHV